MNVYSLEGKVIENLELPVSLKISPRLDIIKRAFLAYQSAERQPYGSDKLAGLRSSAHYHGSRHYRFTMMNKEMSRMPRIHGKIGYLSMTPRIVPHAVKGRRAHPPKAEKVWEQKINKKEYKLALKSAFSTAEKIVFVDDLDKIAKTKELRNVFEKVIKDDIKRCEKRKIKPGKGKMRGRRYRRKVGPLIIATENSKLLETGKNIPGIDVCPVNRLNINMMAPGGTSVRKIILTKSAIKNLEKYLS